jgi:hypothetical protein
VDERWKTLEALDQNGIQINSVNSEIPQPLRTVVVALSFLAPKQSPRLHTGIYAGSAG